MSITYCDGWFRAQKRAVEFLTEDQARTAYNARTLYAALVGDPIRPRCFVECNMDYIGVEFLDDCLRSHVCYQFVEKEPGRLFMTMAVYRQFDGDGENVRLATIYYYREDGDVTVHRVSDGETAEAIVKLDVTANWEPVPEFGCYESIARLDRGISRID
jgi:hypothetical protein